MCGHGGRRCGAGGWVGQVRHGEGQVWQGGGAGVTRVDAGVAWVCVCRCGTREGQVWHGVCVCSVPRV